MGSHPVAAVQYTFTQKPYTERHKTNITTQKFWKSGGPCPVIAGFTSEEKARKNLSQGGRLLPAGTMEIHKHTIRIHGHNNKNT